MREFLQDVYDEAREIWYETNWVVRGAAVIIAGAAVISTVVWLF